MKTVFSFLFFTLIINILNGQVNGNGKLPAYIFDNILNETGDEDLAENIYEDLLFYIDNPININTCTEEELDKLFFINDFQIFSLLSYRKKYGDFFSLNELCLIPGYREDFILLISPFLTISSVDQTKKSKYHKNYFKHDFLMRSQWSFPLKAGFLDDADSLNKFEGAQAKTLFKYQVKMDTRLRAGFNFEKDEGEKFSLPHKNQSSGFISSFVEINKFKYLRKFILGDYRISAGNGLIYGYGRSGKSTEVILSHQLPSLSKYSSSAEYGFYRGGAFNIRIQGFDMIAHFSQIKRDAQTEVIENDGEIISSFPVDGLNRNLKEQVKSKNARETSGGLLIGYSNNRVTAGYNLQYTAFDMPLQYRVRPDRNSSTETADKFILQSLHYSYRKSKILTFGELAVSHKGKLSGIQSLSVNINPLVTTCISYRSYDPEYISFTSAAFSEASGTRNERGFYTVIEAYLFNFLKTSVYIDQYHFPWLRYNASSPYSGKDFVIKNCLTFNRESEFIILFKSEKHYTETPSSDGVKTTSIKKMSEKHDLRFLLQSSWKPEIPIEFKTKVEFRKSETGGTGYVTASFLSQDISLDVLAGRIRLSGRYAIFNIPDWQVRIYAWEQDLLYSFSSPLFYKQGSRVCALAKLKLGNNISFWCKYAANCYNSERESGTGADLRSGKRYDEWKIQLQWKFH